MDRMIADLEEAKDKMEKLDQRATSIEDIFDNLKNKV